MKGFNFEKNLPHQSKAVESAVAVLEGLEIIKPSGTEKHFINPVIDIKNNEYKYRSNIFEAQKKQCIDGKIRGGNIIDIMMETGTGKTYTYTKTVFELNKNFGILKFVVVVPTLSIKAGTINFLNSDSAREHFKEQYGKIINLHIVESVKNGGKNKKSYMPQAISSFVNAGNFDRDEIQLLVINSGMINSETMQKSFDKSLFDKYSIPFEAVSAVKPVMIIDEPHKFPPRKKTWEKLQNMNPQLIFRYGATFPEYQNLVYELTAVDSFNQNLVKGVIGYVEEFEEGKNVAVKLMSTNGKEAVFALIDENNKKNINVAKKESLEKVHSEMRDLFIEKLNKSEVVLSNGLSLKKGDKINPYSFAETLQEKMIVSAVKRHFEIEKEYLTREIKIKPVTLFFIDNIEEYRGKTGYIRQTVEKYIKATVSELLKTETNDFYKEYLEKTIKNISLTHGGYFSKDNTDKDEVIEKEINEILHDKEAILNVNNPRRFIFSKWTLREGWDNPNVFQICKLRSSGSEISKLQEVGRGLRLPVNEYMNRVKDEQFYLNYYVDFMESDFVDKLVNEINEKSDAISIENIPERLSEQMVKKIIEVYQLDEDDLIDELVEKKIIRASHKFLEGGFDYIKRKYSLIFTGVGSNKVRKATKQKEKIRIRTEKYSELQELWEKINEKVLLEYKIENEKQFKNLFLKFLNDNSGIFKSGSVNERQLKLFIDNGQAKINDQSSVYVDDIIPVVTMKYTEFIQELAKVLSINIKTIHNSFKELNKTIDINKFLNVRTIRVIKNRFNKFLLFNAIDKFGIEYQKVTNTIHPTKFTDCTGRLKNTIDASDVGMLFSEEKVADSYFFDQLFYDSELEKDNITENIKEVVVFTKIPKNSIKIPVAGGQSYSPDFAYLLEFKDNNKKLFFVVETKNIEEENLRLEEKRKIKHAERFFDNKIKITFKTQFNNKKIKELIKDVYEDT